ncbi:spermatogenesis-associated protein 20 isoform X1 [Monodelphis domestica]|uniref:spermatogenesis-associated protein 20 isoform X1 n=1 Tax=Monodelphis domestica TaxID=13616 RepID=UPI0004432A26|nr:spermatogenesis-associated protein 20 isoform X1 [Monodelphis domestica]
MSHLSSALQKQKRASKYQGLFTGPERSMSLSSPIAMATGAKDQRQSLNQTQPPVPNRLIHEKSPYLLQHAYNPVDWFPWGQEAFDKAKKENKPIFLSVGYSTCHWCHVMEEESFQNKDIGQILSEDFVSIKVDREERPDVDKVYMTFVQATSSGGGWPMNVWLTPDLQPFVGGTYFPPEDGVTRVGFRTVLLRIREQWKQNKAMLMANSQRVTASLLARSEICMGDRELPPSASAVSNRCFQQLEEVYDEEHGGFAEVPKFPTPVILSFLFSYWATHRMATDGFRAQQMAMHTLKMMANGGIRDHVGQGFHRYSTDRQWHIPHFEKMLYDQAQLAVAYIQAFQISGDEFFADIAKDILQYVSQNLSHQSGGFCSAEDADSMPEGEKKPKEGAYYLWKVKEIKDLLPDPVEGSNEPLTLGQLFMKHYGITENGNIGSTQDPHGELQGQNVLTVRYSMDLTAARYGLEAEAVRTLLDIGREKLIQTRKRRPRPRLDSKMLAAWNGLMVSGYAITGATLGNEEMIKQAIDGAKFLKRHLFDVSSGRLIRGCYAGAGGTVEQSSSQWWGFLEDYAFVIRGLLDLYEASRESAWLEWALKLQDMQDKLFWDTQGGGYFCNEVELRNDLPLRLKDDQDGSEPSANSVSAHNLLRIHGYTGRRDYMEKCVKLLTAFSDRLWKVPVALPEMVRALIIQQQTVKQVVICGSPQTTDTQALINCVHSVYVPNKVLILTDGDPSSFLARQLPFLARFHKLEGRATAYVCENQAYSMPVTEPAELRKLLLL